MLGLSWRPKEENIVKHKQQGFTIVELMIATTVFSFILIVASSGIVSIGQLYYKGITSSKTQEVARNIMDEVARARQFSNDSGSYTDQVIGGYKAVCFGEARFSYKINQKVDNTAGTKGLIYKQRSLSGECKPDIDTSTGGEEMLANNMRLLDFGVTSIDTYNNKFRVVVKVAYGDNDLLSMYDDNAGPADSPLVPEAEFNQAQCKSGIAGRNFCSVSELATIVNKRI